MVELIQYNGECVHVTDLDSQMSCAEWTKRQRELNEFYSNNAGKYTLQAKASGSPAFEFPIEIEAGKLTCLKGGVDDASRGAVIIPIVGNMVNSYQLEKLNVLLLVFLAAIVWEKNHNDSRHSRRCVLLGHRCVAPLCSTLYVTFITKNNLAINCSSKLVCTI